MKRAALFLFMLLLQGCVTDGIRPQYDTYFSVGSAEIVNPSITYKYKHDERKLRVVKLTSGSYSFVVPFIRFSGLFLSASPPEHEEYLEFKDGDVLLKTLTLREFRNLPKNREGAYVLSLSSD